MPRQYSDKAQRQLQAFETFKRVFVKAKASVEVKWVWWVVWVVWVGWGGGGGVLGKGGEN